MPDGYFENTWAFWLLIPAILFVWVEWWFRRRPLWILFPRLAWILALAFLIADWHRVTSKEFSEASLIRVFFDQSDSVRYVSERQERMKTFFEEIKTWADRENQPVQYYVFSRETLPVSGEEFPILPYSDFTSVEMIAKNPSTEGSVLIVSDGNFIDAQRFSQPVYSVQIGRDDERDIWIDEFPPVFTAFLKNRVQLPLIISQTGFEGQEVSVQLSRGTEVLQKISLELNEPRNPVELSYFPEKMGEEILEVEVESLGGELSSINNRVSTRIRTVRDKIRILHVSGKPSLDLKAWRLFLTRQPDVDLVSFYILRSLDDDPQARNTELSLIPFPYEDLFTTELEKFDIVILQNFNFNLYFQPFYLRNLARFVESGGALLMMGGDQSFQHYQDTPLETLFPFQYTNGGAFEFGSYVAEIGLRHPLTEDLAWAFQRPKWSTRHALKSHPESEVLVRYKDKTPLLSLREVAGGRVLTLNTDETWRLQFESLGDYIPFGRFARRVLQYLTFDPEMEAQKVSSSEWSVGEEVELRLSNAAVADWRIGKGSKAWEFSNSNVIKWEVSEPGVYEVQVSTLPEVYRYETEEKPWLNEWKNLISKNSTLKNISDSTNAEFFTYEERQKIFERPLSGKQIISATTQSWSNSSNFVSWAALIAILCFLCLDFFLRKKHQWDA